MRLLTITNLYPRPDQPQRGLFNAQQFRAMAEALEKRCKVVGGGWEAGGGRSGDASPVVNRQSSIVNLCLVPEWRIWRWREIRRWRDPFENRLGTRYVPVFYLPLVGRGVSWRFYAWGLQAVRNLASRCDALLATWLYPDAVAAASLAKAVGKPLWIKVHGTDRFHLDHPQRRKVILSACTRAAGVICVSENVAAALREAGVVAEQVHAVPNGVDHERFRCRPRAEAFLGLPQTAVRKGGSVVLYVGNLAGIKGPDVLLNAWAQVCCTMGKSGAQLVILGEGPMRRVLEQKARQLGIGGSVVFAGSVSHEHVARWMNIADCLCLPSLSEGMPNVVIEALVSGLPVIASEVGACGELLRGEPCSRLVPAGNAAALAEAIQGVLSQPLDREDMAARHAARYSWTRSAEIVLGMIKEKIDDRRQTIDEGWNDDSATE